MKYSYSSSQELKDIISNLEKGEDKSFSIYNDKGRRVKYDFDSHIAKLMIIDDGQEQPNPYYVEKVVEEPIKEEVVEETEAPAPIEEEQPSPEPEVGEKLEVEETPAEPVSEEIPLPELRVLSDLSEDGTLEVAFNDNSEVAAQLSEAEYYEGELAKKDEIIADLESKNADLNIEVFQLSNKVDSLEDQNTDELIQRLVTKGYKVTISK